MSSVAACDKQIACNAIDKESRSLDIWEHPELCFQEHHAHQVITDFLEERGFQVERNYNLDTAFRANACSKDAGADSPHVGVMCEYDALPEIGHGCGHNLIAIMGVAISLGIKEAFEHAGVKGKLTVLGCPAEEGGGGKIDLIHAGAFSDLDIALMAHPSQINVTRTPCVAMTIVDIRFEGKESHAACSPWEGINALDAAVLCYQSVSCLRQQLKPSWRVHGIFIKGGELASIIPPVSQLLYFARAPTRKEMEKLKEKLIGCFEGAAVASGCKVAYTFCPKSYDSLVSNDVLVSLYEANAESLGIKFERNPTRIQSQDGSTDMGKVSTLVPSIHPSYSLHTEAPSHSVEFREVSKAGASHEVILCHAKALAMAAIDVYNDPCLVTTIKERFTCQVADEDRM